MTAMPEGFVPTPTLQDVRYGGAGTNAPTVAINAAGCLLFAAIFTADQRAADTRIARRDEVCRCVPLHWMSPSLPLLGMT